MEKKYIKFIRLVKITLEKIFKNKERSYWLIITMVNGCFLTNRLTLGSNETWFGPYPNIKNCLYLPYFVCIIIVFVKQFLTL
jgi:hypothetical protein